MESLIFIPREVFIPLTGQRPGMNGTGGSFTGYKIMQLIGTDHIFSDLKSMQIVLAE